MLRDIRHVHSRWRNAPQCWPTVPAANYRRQTWDTTILGPDLANQQTTKALGSARGTRSQKPKVQMVAPVPHCEYFTVISQV